MLLRHARCVLSRLRWNGLRLLLSSSLSRIGRIENPCSACGHLSSHSALSSYGLFAPLAIWPLSLYNLWSRHWADAQLWGSMVFRHVPIPRKGLGNNNNMSLKIDCSLSNTRCIGCMKYNYALKKHCSEIQYF